MEPIYVVIADKSQLVRLGLISILNKIGYKMNIREIFEPIKFDLALRKENKSIVFVSKSFLNICSPDVINLMISKHRQFRFVLINDNTALQKSNVFDENIEFLDTEKNIIQKFESCIHGLTNMNNYIKNANDISLREKDVLKLVALGMTNKEIAEKLFISSHTVITHRKNITAKLGIKTIAGLTVYAVINKLIEASEIK